MSGPKAVEVRPTAEELARRAAVARYAAALSALARHQRALAAITTEATAAGCVLEARGEQPGHFHSASFQASSGLDESAAAMERHAAAVRDEVAAAKQLLWKHLAETPGRFRRAHERHRALVYGARAVLQQLAVIETDSSSAVERIASMKSACSGIASIVAPPAEGVTAEQLANLPACERALAAGEQEILQLRKTVTAIIDEQWRRTIKVEAAAPATTLASILAARTPVETVAQGWEDDGGILERLDRLMADVVLLQDTPLWHEIRVRADAIRAEPDSVRRISSFHGLVADCAEQCRQRRVVEAWREDIDALTDTVAHLDAAEAPDLLVVLRDLDALRRAARVVPLDAYRTRLNEVRAQAEQRAARQRTRAALLDALQSLGYESGATMSTALVEGGRLLVRRAADSPYAVEILASPDLARIQTALVRFSNTDGTNDLQRKQDVTEESAWCADHARIREYMSKHGLDTRFIMRNLPGQKPVRVIRDLAAGAQPGRATHEAAVAQPKRATLDDA